MNTRVDPPEATNADARHALCRHLVQTIREGEIGMKIRFVQTDETTRELWVYTNRQHAWTKRDDLIVPLHLATAMQSLLEGLAKQEYADAWTCHSTKHSDRIDFEIKFSRESIEPHVKGDLESYLNGCLAHEHHDSGKDSRRRIRFQGQ